MIKRYIVPPQKKIFALESRHELGPLGFKSKMLTIGLLGHDTVCLLTAEGPVPAPTAEQIVDNAAKQ